MAASVCLLWTVSPEAAATPLRQTISVAQKYKISKKFRCMLFVRTTSLLVTRKKLIKHTQLTPRLEDSINCYS